MLYLRLSKCLLTESPRHLVTIYSNSGTGRFLSSSISRSSWTNESSLSTFGLSSKIFLKCRLINQRVRTSSLLHTSASWAFIFGRMGNNNQSVPSADGPKRNRKNKVKLSDAEWKDKLTPQQYDVCRRHGTERAFTGELNESRGKGVYKCACCGADLFNSSSKYDSGSGWPSFYETLKDKDDLDLPAVDYTTDRKLGMVRTEVTCGKCDSHLGHVFNDGPNPTGMRYCINSASLQFKKEKDPKAGL